jgi:C4-dicarboxylate-binding protein DctP
VLRNIVKVSFILAASLLLSIDAAAQAPLIIKFSYTIPADTPKGKAVQRFKELVEARTQGRVKVEAYPSATLYKDNEEIDALQLGSVQMLAPAVSKFGPLGVREFEAFDLPYLFDGEAALHKVVDGPIGQDLLKKLEPRGVSGLAYWASGFRHLSLKVPRDARGLKFRIPSSKVIDAEIRSIGAIPQTMSASEVYQGLQTGVVDATEATASNLYSQKLYEVQKNFTLTRHSALVYAVIVNKKFWDGLPPATRSILEGAMKEATAYHNEVAAKENADALEAIRKSGKTEVYQPTEAELVEWKKALLKVHAQAGPKIGMDLIQAIYKTTGFDPKRYQ